MSTLGTTLLAVAFASLVVTVTLLVAGCCTRLLRGRNMPPAFCVGGCVAFFISVFALFCCCGLLVYCFLIGDTSLEYVVYYRTDSTSKIAWLFKIAGLWGGKQGSLLFWAWLIMLFGVPIAVRVIKSRERIDGIALAILSSVSALFVGSIFLSSEGMPFIPLDPSFIDSEGNLVGVAALWGLSPLLEHWAMVVHPPLLFVGYAGLTVPFAYAVSSLICNDVSDRWMIASQGATKLAWLFLSMGIGAGAIWAYSVMGWGGYWGWDPVENASLLPWLAGVALMHSFIVCCRRGHYRRWTVFCACITFSFVAFGAYLTRSGVIGSVHAFDGDFESAIVFLCLIATPIILGVCGLVIRRRSFVSIGVPCEFATSVLSKDIAFYLNNLFLMTFAIVIAYLTLAPVLPSWMPFGASSVGADTYNALAAPFGVAYCAVLAICPLLSWCKTDGVLFWKRLRKPGACAAALSCLLIFYFATRLFPRCDTETTLVDIAPEGLSLIGNAWYHNGLAVCGLLVASLLLFTSVSIVLSRVACCGKRKGCSVRHAGRSAHRGFVSLFGGSLVHAALACVLIGLIGSTMYDVRASTSLSYDAEADVAAESFVIENYELRYREKTLAVEANRTDLFNTIYLDVYKDGAYQTTVSPSVQELATTQQQFFHAVIINSPLEDLFVVYKGVVKDAGGMAFLLEAQIKPFASFLWIGFVLLVIGTGIAMFERTRDLS